MSLVVIGVLMLNSEKVGGESLLPGSVWTLLFYISVILIWNSTSHGGNRGFRNRFYRMRFAGIGVMIMLVLLFKRNDIHSFIEIRTEWWGILGLIGWAYLIACVFYIPLRKYKSAIAGVIGLLYGFYFASAAGLFQNLPVLSKYFNLGFTFGTHGAIVMSGVFLGMIIIEYDIKNKGVCIGWAFFYGIIFLLTGIFINSLSRLHEMFYLDKNLGTPAWGLISSALTVGLWILIYWINDIRRIRQWSGMIRRVGKNPLFAYILAPALAALFQLFSEIMGIDNWYTGLGESFYIGLVRSFIFTVAVIWMTGFFMKRNVHLKL